LINLINAKGNESQCKNNSNREKINGNNTKKGITCPFVNKCFLICVTIFSTLLPIGVQPQIEFNYAFAELNSQSIKDDTDYSDGDENSSYSSTSEAKSKLNVKNPFEPAYDNNKKVKTNIIIPDIVESDIPVAEPSSTTDSDEMGAHSIRQDHPNSVDKSSSSNTDNADVSVIVEKEKEGNPTTTELSSTDSQIGTLDNNEDNNANDITSIISDDKSSTELSQSELGSQPKYKSYRDFIENSTSSSEEFYNVTDDTPGHMLNSTYFQSGTVYGNIDVNINKTTNSDNINNILLLEKITSTESSSTSSSKSVQAKSSNEVYGDFNGDGFDDLAIGAPFEDVGSIVDAGGVEVIYGSSSGLSATSAHADQFWTQDSTNIDDIAELEDQFGLSLAIGDFNADGFDDLAIGVGEDVGSISGAGGVEVIYGSSSGLSSTAARPDQFWTQDSTNIDDSAEPGDFFGSSLTVGDFNADGKDDLAIGVTAENVGSIVDAGGVEVIYGSSSGLSATSAHIDQFWTQDGTNIDNSAEPSDNFGSPVTAGDFNADGKDDLAIGVPHENLGSIVDAGGVEVIYGSSSGLSATSAHADQFWTQDSTDIGGSAEPTDEFGGSLATGDFNADGKDDLAIGLPGEDIGSTLNVGGVQVIYGSSNGLSATSAHVNQFWTQDSPDIENKVHSDNKFGFSLTAGDFNADGKDDLAIGVPFENLGPVVDIIPEAGGVEVIYGSSSGLSATSAHADQFWTQDIANIDNSAEPNDNFGYSLATGDFNADGKVDLAIGAPFENVGSLVDAGGVEVIYGSSSGLSATSAHADQFWTQDSTDIDNSAEDEDLFGFSLG